MTSYLLDGISLVALAAVGVAGVQSTRLADARAGLATIQSDLDAANARIERQSRQADAVQRSLSSERDRAVTAERQASNLRERIARDAGTDRDGETAPVLRDTIRGLQRTADRLDSLYNGRQPDQWMLLVIIDGKIDRRDYAKDEATCRATAMASALELSARPELVADAGRVWISCTAVRPGERV